MSQDQQLNKSVSDLNDILMFMRGTATGDDKGIAIEGGQLSTGAPGDGHEVAFGEGDSYPVPFAWHVDYADISGLTVTNATDISAILQSDTGSTTGLFGGAVAGKCILVMSDVGRYGGAKIKMDTAGTVEADSVVAEYLQDNAPTWVQTKFMATDADFPLEQKANVLGSCSSCSEQWRFSFDPDDLPPTWDEVTLSVNGTDYTGRWAIFRTTDTITLDPVIEHLKLHTNHMEANSGGSSEYMGRARYPKTLNVEIYENADKTSQNQSVPVGTGITLTEVNNKLPDNSESGRVVQGNIPVGLDTSIPLKATVEWYADVATAGNVELTAELIKVRNGFVFDGAESPITLAADVTSVNNEQYKRQKSSFKFFVDDLIPGDQWYLAISRNSLIGNPNDTLSGAVVITYTETVGYFWRP